MPIEYHDNRVLLVGLCTVEEAEGLLGWLLKNPEGEVDLFDATHLHMAVLQALLAGSGKISATPEDDFWGRWIGPLLDQNSTIKG